MTVSTNEKVNKQKVVIVGGNFAGLSAAKQFATLNNNDLDIYLIDPTDAFNWTPNVHEILSGAKSEASVEVPRDELVANLDLTFLKASVTTLDTSNQSVTLNDGTELKFDACLVTCGYQPINRYDDSASFSFRNARDITRISQAIDSAAASENNVAISIIGGGFTGVEALGELLRKYTNASGLTVTVFESSDRLVKDLAAEISQDIVTVTASLPVSYRFNSRISQVENGQITLADGSTHKSDITIWTVGGELPPFVAASGLVEPSENGIAVDNTLQCMKAPCCFAAGDAASVYLASGKSLSKQSYHAIDSGKVAATNVVKWLRNETLDAFVPRPKPILLSLGNVNTYMSSGDSVVASPLLAATKEAIYQVSMYKLFSYLPPSARNHGLFDRFAEAANQLLLPELKPTTLLKILIRSRIVSYGGVSDIKPLVQAIHSIVSD